MEPDLLGKMLPNGLSAVAVIVVVWMFLKSMRDDRSAASEQRKEFIDSMRTIRAECHVMTENNQRTFQAQMSQTVERVSKVADGYESAMQTFAAAIASNGEVLQRMEKHMKDERRGAGRRNRDWHTKEEQAV